MTRPTILNGVVFALTASVLAVPFWWGVSHALAFPQAFRLALVAAAWAQLAYLLAGDPARAGGVTLAALNFLFGVAILLASPTIPVTAALLAIMATLTRTLLKHRSLLSLALDSALAILSLLFAGYLYRESGSFAVALWGYLLVQSTWVLIPSAGAGTGRQRMDDLDAFLRGQRQAEAALERIERNSTGI